VLIELSENSGPAKKLYKLVKVLKFLFKFVSPPFCFIYESN